MNDENLKANQVQSGSEAREMGRKGGIASGKARRLKSRRRQLVLDMLALKEIDPKILADIAKSGIDPADITEEVALHHRQIQKAIRKADTSAYLAVLKAAGILQEEINLGTQQPGGININLGTKEAAEGLRHAIETGAQPAPPEE